MTITRVVIQSFWTFKYSVLFIEQCSSWTPERLDAIDQVAKGSSDKFELRSSAKVFCVLEETNWQKLTQQTFLKLLKFKMRTIQSSKRQGRLSEQKFEIRIQITVVFDSPCSRRSKGSQVENLNKAATFEKVHAKGPWSNAKVGQTTSSPSTLMSWPISFSLSGRLRIENYPLSIFILLWFSLRFSLKFTLLTEVPVN